MNAFTKKPDVSKWVQQQRVSHIVSQNSSKLVDEVKEVHPPRMSNKPAPNERPQS